MKSHLEQEILSQPDVLRELLREEHENIQQIAAAIREYNPRYVLIAARGTSDNAARYAQYLFGVRVGMVVSLATPSVHTLYGAAPNMQSALVIGISQSGASEDIRRVVADANRLGALTLAITNDPESPLAGAAAHSIYMHAGQERSVAATKTYTSELMAVAMLVGALEENAEFNAILHHAPDYVADSVQRAVADIPLWVERYRYMDQYVVIGRGYNYATAFEISLKIKELCYITGEQYSEADFRHGPMALVEPGFPVMMVMPTGAVFERQLDLLKQLCEKEAETLIISDAEAVRERATKFMSLPTGVPEWLSPMTAVVPGQVFVWQLARARGLSVDAPRGLNKVTVTE